MRTKRGQAAMEFLMTYGWAILAAVIVIGVLASFGVFSPSKYVPTSCTLAAPFGCVENQVTATTDNITFVMTNGGGVAVTISSIAIDGCGAYNTSTDIGDGEDTAITVDCSPSISTGKFNGGVTINYRTESGQLDLKSSGSITVDVA